jgi:hypothetical protein
MGELVEYDLPGGLLLRGVLHGGDGRTAAKSHAITVTSFSTLNEISTDPLHRKYRVLMRREGVTPPAPTPFYSWLMGRYLKTT